MHSHSATSTFNNCPWKHRLQQLGYRSQVLDEKSNKKMWGIAGHAALRLIHLGANWAMACEEFQRLYPVDLNPKDRAWSLDSACIMLERYVARWGSQLDEYEVLESEFHNEESERESEGHLVLDLVTRHKPSGTIYPWDHKFKSEWKGGQSYELDAQLSRYAAYVKDKWGDFGGFMLNVIVPQHRQKKWMDRPAGYDPQFHRKLYSRTPGQIEWWRESQADWEWTIKTCDEAKRWPKHQGSLCGYCEFYDGCYAQSQGAGMDMFEQLYRPGTRVEQITIEVED